MSSFGNRFKRGGGHFSSARYEELDGESLMTEQEQVRRRRFLLSFCFRLSLSVPLTMMMIKMSRRFSLRE